MPTRAVVSALLQRYSDDLSRGGANASIGFAEFLELCGISEEEKSALEDARFIRQVLRKLRQRVQEAIKSGTIEDDREAFDSFDRSGSGRISRSEFRQGLEAMGFDLTKKESDALIRRFDVDGKK